MSNFIIEILLLSNVNSYDEENKTALYYAVESGL
jgi:hypothetical protein